MKISGDVVFQSAPRERGERAFGGEQWTAEKVSIRAPRAGRKVGLLALVGWITRFQSAPRERGESSRASRAC